MKFHVFLTGAMATAVYAAPLLLMPSLVIPPPDMELPPVLETVTSGEDQARPDFRKAYPSGPETPELALIISRINKTQIDVDFLNVLRKSLRVYESPFSNNTPDPKFSQLPSYLEAVYLIGTLDNEEHYAELPPHIVDFVLNFQRHVRRELGVIREVRQELYNYESKWSPLTTRPLSDRGENVIKELQWHMIYELRRQENIRQFFLDQVRGDNVTVVVERPRLETRPDPSCEGCG